MYNPDRVQETMLAHAVYMRAQYAHQLACLTLGVAGLLASFVSKKPRQLQGA